MKLTYFLYTYIFLHIFGYTLYVNAILYSILKINNFFYFYIYIYIILYVR